MPCIPNNGDIGTTEDMIKITALLVFMLLSVFELTSQNAVAQEPTFGPICDDITVTCPPTPPVGQPETPTNVPPPTNTPIVYPSETPIITAIPDSGVSGPTIGIIVGAASLMLTGLYTFTSVRR